MLVKKIVIPKAARYFLSVEPGRHIQQVWFVCHGYGHLANEFLENFNILNNGYRLIVAPEGLHRFYLLGSTGKVGASWMTKEDRLNEIKDYVNFLDGVYAEVMGQLDNSSVIVNALGFSQGTAAACRWSLQGKCRIHRLILWAGDFPPDTDWNASRQRLTDMDIQLVFGEKDPYLNPVLIDQQTGMLKKNNVNFKLKTFKGYHEIDSTTLLELALEIEKYGGVYES